MADPLLGKQLGDYVIQELLGRGGMARVYKGYDERLQRFAAVKVINSEQAPLADQAEYAERFRREARAIARLHHPNIVGVFQFGEYETSYYMAMVFVEGKDLRQILKDHAEQGEKMPYDEVLNIIRGISSALDYAHSRGVIHRDIKPSNIMLDNEERAILTDFGLALNTQEGTLGDTFGSAHYIAPEQAVSSAKAVPQSDLYSLGVCLYEMLAGKVPFDDPSAMSVALKHLNDAPPPPRLFNPDLPPAVERVILKILDKDPNQRYANGAQLTQALEQALFGNEADETFELPVASATDVSRSTAAFDVHKNGPTSANKAVAAAPVAPVVSSNGDQAKQKRVRKASGANEEVIATAIGPAAVANDASLGRRPVDPAAASGGRGRILIPALLALLLLGGGAAFIASSASRGASTPTPVPTAVALVETSPATAAVALIETAAATESPTNTAASTEVATVAATESASTAAATAALSIPATQPATQRPTKTSTATATPTKTKVPTKTATSTSTATDTATDVPTAEATASNTPTATFTEGAATEAVAVGTADAAGGAKISLTYDDYQFVLINESNHVVNLGKIRFAQPGDTEATSRSFDTLLLYAPGSQYTPDALPPKFCFQIYRNDRLQPTPSAGCSVSPRNMRAAWAKVAAASRFWLPSADGKITTFQVFLDDKLITTCDIAAGHCEFTV